ncbi:MAG: hypothetical protein GY868_13165 [Deltaproteobacteria bacterium]|nr:hypothetical protein [Deltaproteobacteria bacterium]
MKVTKGLLRIMAAIIWYCGGVVLTLKGGVMLKEAFVLDPGYGWIVLTALCGVGLGLIKAKFIFSHALTKNLKRIAELGLPVYPWQCYRLGFFIFLAVVITLSKFMTDWAAGHFLYLLLIAALDLSIATALLSTSFLFWRKPAPS